MNVIIILLITVVVTVYGQSIPGNSGSNYIPEPETVANLYEGDIMIDSFRNMVKHEWYRWPDNTLIYEYWDGEENKFNEYYQPMVDSAMQHLVSVINARGECIKIRKRKPEDGDNPHFVSIVADKGCWSAVGRRGNLQKMSLGPGCTDRGTVMHETMHALGLWHEQSRLDRDEYVTINYDNIAKENWWIFHKQGHSDIDSLNTPYDYKSLMHYGSKYFSKNGGETIVPKYKYAQIGERKKLSEWDVKKIRILYGCDPKPEHPPTPPVFTEPYRKVCDFKDDFCGMVSSGDFQWYRQPHISILRMNHKQSSGKSTATLTWPDVPASKLGYDIDIAGYLAGKHWTWKVTAIMADGTRRELQNRAFSGDNFRDTLSSKHEIESGQSFSLELTASVSGSETVQFILNFIHIFEKL